MIALHSNTDMLSYLHLFFSFFSTIDLTTTDWIYADFVWICVSSLLSIECSLAFVQSLDFDKIDAIR